MARPPARSDADLAALIAELSARGGKPTGTALRRELKSRFGTRCGTQRIYRLLNSPSSPAASDTRQEPSERIAALAAERDAALARAELSEFRERAHQDKWANEIHDLRQEVARLKRAGLSR